MTNTITEFPEIFLAIFLGFFYFAARISFEDWHFPEVIAVPAVHLLSFMPASYQGRIQNLLICGGFRSPYSYGDFFSIKLCLFLAAMVSSLVLPLHIVLIASLLLLFLPDLILLFLVQRRRQQIRDNLPQAIDLMVLCVDAGLGLDAALQRISADTIGVANALNDELNILSHEIFLGKDREKAYLELYTRTGVDELKTLGSALGQASKLGLSISRILRAQSELLRKRQSQKAEEKAFKMPIYMAFPLWLCIMPCLMLLILGPSLIRFYHALHGGG
jgi:pilus assembly protein TadC